jgi:hypothetical protein
MDEEIRRDVAKMEDMERRLEASPIGYGRMTYDRATQILTTKPFADRTGKLTWTLQPRWTVTPWPEAEEVHVGGRSYRPTGWAATVYGLMIIMEVRRSTQRGPVVRWVSTEATPGAASLVVDGLSRSAIEGTVDRPLSAGKPPPVASSSTDLGLGPEASGDPEDRMVIFPLQEGDAPGSPAMLRVGGPRGPVASWPVPEGALVVSADGASPSLASELETFLERQVAPVRQDIAATRADVNWRASPSTGGGCLLALLIMGLILWYVASVH